MNPHHSHTHCQATQANALIQAWQRVCLTNRKNEKQTDEKNTEPKTSGIKHWGLMFIRAFCTASSSV